MARLENPAGAAVGGAPTAHKTTHEPGGSDALTLLDSTSMVAAARGTGPVWRQVFHAVTRVVTASTAATYRMVTSGAGPASGANSTGVVWAFRLAAADYAAAGLEAKLRVSSICAVNAVAPAASFTVGLYPVTVTGGATGGVTYTLGTVVTGSTVAHTTPGASSLTDGQTAAFALPADGLYMLGVVLDATVVALSEVHLCAHVQVHHE